MSEVLIIPLRKIATQWESGTRSDATWGRRPFLHAACGHLVERRGGHAYPLVIEVTTSGAERPEGLVLDDRKAPLVELFRAVPREAHVLDDRSGALPFAHPHVVAHSGGGRIPRTAQYPPC